MRRCVFVPRLDRGQERLLEVLEARRVCDREPRLVRDPREELHRPLGKPRLRPVLDDRDDEPLAVVFETSGVLAMRTEPFVISSEDRASSPASAPGVEARSSDEMTNGSVRMASTPDVSNGTR